MRKDEGGERWKGLFWWVWSHQLKFSRWRPHRGRCEWCETEAKGHGSEGARDATSMERCVAVTVKLPEDTRRGRGRDVCAMTPRTDCCSKFG